MAKALWSNTFTNAFSLLPTQILPLPKVWFSARFAFLEMPLSFGAAGQLRVSLDAPQKKALIAENK